MHTKLTGCLFGIAAFLLMNEGVNAQIWKNTPVDPGTWRLPSRPRNDTSSFQVQTPKIDEHGYYYEESPNGGRYYDKSKRGTLLRDARTGRAFWKLGDLTCLAAPQYQQQLDQQERAQREQELRRQQEMQARQYQLQQAEAYRRQVEYRQWQERQRNEMLRQQLQGLVDAVERRQGNDR